MNSRLVPRPPPLLAGLRQAEREYNGWLCSRSICVECQSILQMVYCEWEPTDINSVLPTSHTLLTLRSSAKKCPICELFLTDLNMHGFQEAEMKAWASRVMYSTPIRWLNTDLRGIRLEIRHPITHDIFAVSSLHLWRPAIGNGDVLQQASRFTDCARSWERAKHWLQTCLESHPDCHRKIEPGNLPSRLVYVGRNLYDLRLYVSKDLPPNTQYLTLSHCWGSKPFLTLKRTNMEAFFKRIPFDRLSKTFKDAIISTRRLGFDYIWIDSLCIIQDDRVDWSTEAGTMGTVYANSSLNLGAIDSPDGDTGLFFWRPEKKILGWRVKIPLAQHQQGLPQNESVWDCVPARRRESFDNSVLSSRAWVFQERFLAPRNLYFGTDELSWECRTHRAYEASPFRHKFASQEIQPANSALLNITNSTEQWFRLVTHYSKGELTVASDKLTALSGVARLFALKSGKTYIAGLWKEDLLMQLLWETDVPKTKIDIYRAPSWSWAAVDSQVYLLRDTRPTWGPLVSVKQYFVEPSQSVFEDARGAYILLQTHGLKSCLIAKWKGKRGDWGWGQLGRYVIELPWLPPRAQLYNRLTLDFKDADLKGVFYMLQMMDGRGLILSPTSKGTFVRVGCFRDWILKAPDVESESKEMLEFVGAKKREWEKLTEGERGVLGESVGMDEHGVPLYVIKLV